MSEKKRMHWGEFAFAMLWPFPGGAWWLIGAAYFANAPAGVWPSIVFAAFYVPLTVLLVSEISDQCKHADYPAAPF